MSARKQEPCPTTALLATIEAQLKSEELDDGNREGRFKDGSPTLSPLSEGWSLSKSNHLKEPPQVTDTTGKASPCVNGGVQSSSQVMFTNGHSIEDDRVFSFGFDDDELDSSW